MHDIDYERYPLLINPNTAGRPTASEETPFGFLFNALKNYLAIEYKGKNQYPSDTKLAFALFALPPQGGLGSRLSRTKLYQQKSEHILLTYRGQVVRLANKCIGAANRHYRENRLARRLPRNDIDSLYTALDYSLSTDNVRWDAKVYGDDEITLKHQLEAKPITGYDEFSEAMGHVYERVFGSVTPHGNDLTNCARLAWEAWAPQATRDVEPVTNLTATFEVLKVIVMGILFGPKGLDLYSRKTETPLRLDGFYEPVCLGFALTQLLEDHNEGDVGYYSGYNTVELRREANPTAEYFSPTRRYGNAIHEACTRVSDPHAYITPFDMGSSDPRWYIEERKGGTQHGTAIRRAGNGMVGLLGKEAVELNDGDEIWLAPKIKDAGLAPDYKGGAVIRFQKVFDYRYKQNDDSDMIPVNETTGGKALSQATEPAWMESPQQKRIGFSVCPLDKETLRPQDALRRTHYFAHPNSQKGFFEYTIGRDEAAVDYSYDMGYRLISREHASITPSGNGVILHEGTTTNQNSTNGMEVVRRDGKSIFIGGKSPQKECPLEDGDVIYFTARTAPFSILYFSYEYEEPSQAER